MTRLVILFAVVFVMVVAIFGWMRLTYLPRATPMDIFFYMTPALKLWGSGIVVLTSLGVIGGFKGQALRVRIVAITTLALGVLGAAYGEMNTHFGVLYDGPVNFATMAPGRLESLAILVLGLFGGLVTLGVFELSGVARRLPDRGDSA